MIQLQNITKLFERAGKVITVLDDITTQFAEGSFSLIAGPSGVGKSTLLTLIAGTQAPTSGKILCDGNDSAQFSSQAHAKFLHSYIGLVFQYPHLIPEFSVIENVALKGLITGMSTKESTKRAECLLERVGLAGYAEQWPQALSGGEQQRVAVARALFLRPRFLLADEPTAHLDDESREVIIRLITAFQSEHAMGVIVCSHDGALREMADQRYELKQGRLTQQG